MRPLCTPRRKIRRHRRKPTYRSPHKRPAVVPTSGGSRKRGKLNGPALPALRRGVEEGGSRMSHRVWHWLLGRKRRCDTCRWQGTRAQGVYCTVTWVPFAVACRRHPSLKDSWEPRNDTTCPACGTAQKSGSAYRCAACHGFAIPCRVVREDTGEEVSQ